MVDEKEVVMVELDHDDDDEGEDEEVKRLVENKIERVKWENLLPKMVVRVLLVEADDSTRQIIAALLRKSNYKVAAISNGLKAWEIVKRKHNSIDLILTELDLPSISGYALLSLIMEHDGCKNIPVIIMSSQDSINMVMKCMLKGATDFLMKPVRKNELKNLWRHVWKRLTNVHNPQNFTRGPCKVEATFEDHATTQLSNDDISFSQKNSKNLSQVNDREEDGLNEKGKHYLNTIKLEELDTNISDSEQAIKLASGVRASEDESCTGVATDDDDYRQRANSDIDGHEFPEPSHEAEDLIGGINKQKCCVGQSGFSEGLDCHCTSTELELSLRRSVDPESTMVDERHALNHSSASAFSRYGDNKKPRAVYASPEGDVMGINGALDGTINNSYEGSMHEVRESVDQHCPKSSLVDQSGENAAVCDDFVAQSKTSAHVSFSEATDVNLAPSEMVGTSAVDESGLRDNVGSTFDQDRFRSRVGLHTAEREAALAKFRLKRKDRCFEKKVRYQSRKKLAEQRPRVKGQFVRQPPKDQILSDADDK